MSYENESVKNERNRHGTQETVKKEKSRQRTQEIVPKVYRKHRIQTRAGLQIMEAKFRGEEGGAYGNYFGIYGTDHDTTGEEKLSTKEQTAIKFSPLSVIVQERGCFGVPGWLSP